MKLKIKHKLFLILVSASVLIIAGMYIFTRLSFERGLIRYVDTMEMRHLSTMARILEENYASEKNWAFMTEDPMAWERFKRFTFRQWRMEGNGCNPRFMGPTHNNRFAHPPKMEPMVRVHKNIQGRGQGPGRGLVLLDRDKKRLIGENEAVDKSRMIPVNFEGETVGYLGMAEPCSRVEDEELLFFKGQSRMFLMIAMGMVLVAVIVAVWTAYYLEVPIKTLTRGTRDLASGLFKTRIPVKSNDELGRLSEDFNTLAETLEGNERDRKTWVEDIAHELRTPLTLLSGELEAVEDGVRELNEDTLKRLKGDIDHLIVLVNDLNELSRTDKGALSYKKEPMDLVALVKRVAARFQDAFRENGLQWTDSIPDDMEVKVFADPERLSQMLVNLLQNSLNHTHGGGKVDVCMEVTKGWVHVVVEDSKPGVPDESLPRLFERLYRVEGSRNRKYGGSGLGLAICKNIVEAHGGTITASQSSLGGLSVRIGLPLHGEKA
jgi:two-component system sensor histidine kinase BaeS